MCLTLMIIYNSIVIFNTMKTCSESFYENILKEHRANLELKISEMIMPLNQIHIVINLVIRVY